MPFAWKWSHRKKHADYNKNRALGGAYMISVDRDQILSHFAGIPTVLYILHKIHPAITRKTFHPSKTGSLFCTAEIPFCGDEFFPCNRFSLPKRDKKLKVQKCRFENLPISLSSHESNMPKISHHNTLYFLRYLHVRYVIQYVKN